MVFLTLDDVVGSTEVVVFNSVYANSREHLISDRVLVVKGRVDHKKEGKLIAIEVTPFEATPARTARCCRLDARTARAGVIRELAVLLRDYPGDAAVFVAMQTSDGAKTYEFGPQFKVTPVPDFFAEVKALLGESAVV